MIERSEQYIASMPNLNLTGLSENWLLKECGHQHWLALAERMGKNEPRFTDVDGNTIYAAFVGLKVNGARFHQVQEHDVFNIRTQLISVGYARHFSEHQLLLNGQVIGQLQLLSTLVNRSEAGNNQSVARAVLAEHAPTSSDNDEVLLGQAEELKSWCKASHKQQVATVFPDFAGGEEISVDDFYFSPSPNSDFNGADFLYFANFQDIADRAEWYWQQSQQRAKPKPKPKPKPEKKPALWQTEHRFISYYGNINLGDELILRRRACLQNDHNLHTWVQLIRSSDQMRVADVVSHKIALNADAYRWASPIESLNKEHVDG